jgi:hypothetical protein
VYEEILALLPVAALRCFGSVGEKGGRFCWLFLEDAGEQEYSPQREEQRVLAPGWLGLMHTSAVGGPRRYPGQPYQRRAGGGGPGGAEGHRLPVRRSGSTLGPGAGARATRCPGRWSTAT